MAKDKLKINKHFGVLKKAEDVSFKVMYLIEQDRFKDITESKLKEYTKEFKSRLKNGETLDNIMEEAFATAYRAIQIVYGINLYRVQIMGGYALHHGDVAEMKTGEGKTLTAILPAYLNALEGKGVHVITVNEYLSKRDALNTGRVFTLLGLTIGSVTSEQNPLEKKEQYTKDITYITNSELGFDYLKDNLVKEIDQKQQRGFNYAIVDEVDSILIDEARTPLIISGGGEISSEEYLKADDIVLKLLEGDYDFDKESAQAFLTPQGAAFIEKELGISNLYSYSNSELVHRIHNSLQAHFKFKHDVDYTVKDGEIVLIDIFTGRYLEGRQYSNGLNQAIEAKERIKIKPETKTFASITYQNLFRMYKKLSGMSGTAVPEEEELLQIYNMRVIPIPTNKPIIRKDKPDMIFSTIKAKFKKVVSEIMRVHETGQPILVGTRSVQDSQIVSEILIQKGINHEVLNAKNHAREADIIKYAGEKNAITISTNMAGRGTDIKLGEGVKELGGLYVIGTERHESRRIDDQLRGRAGRQGDVGMSQFIISLEDEIMNRSGIKKIQKLLGSLDNSPIESKMVSKAITSAQKKLEGLNYDSRKSVIEYDDVTNQQRLLTYKQRDAVLKSNNVESIVESMIKGFVEYISSQDNCYDGDKFSSIKMIDSINYNIKGAKLDSKIISKDETVIYVTSRLIEMYREFHKDIDKDIKEQNLKQVMLYALDTSWQEQLDRLSRLKTSITYRQYAQKNPVQAYVLESNKLFEYYKSEIQEKVSLIVLKKVSEPQVKELTLDDKNERATQEILIK